MSSHTRARSAGATAPSDSYGKRKAVAAAKTTSGFVGCTRTAPSCPVSRSPTKRHVRPASVVFHMPRPVETLLRIPSLPVPT